MLFQDKVTIFTVTHYTDKVDQNRALAPPGTGLLQRTLQTLRHYVQGADLCKHVIIYNRRNGEEHYQDNLRKFCAVNKLVFLEDSSPGYKEVRCKMALLCNTRYVFNLEHDWEWLRPMSMIRLVDIMDNHRFVKLLRFNKRRNVVAAQDRFLEQEDRIAGYNLLRTPSWTNNPHICRTESLREWAKLAAKPHHFDGKNRGAGGFEQPLSEASLRDAKTMTPLEHSNRWGLYVYGDLDDDPYIKHLGV